MKRNSKPTLNDKRIIFVIAPITEISKLVIRTSKIMRTTSKDEISAYILSAYELDEKEIEELEFFLGYWPTSSV